MSALDLIGGLLGGGTVIAFAYLISRIIARIEFRSDINRRIGEIGERRH